MKKLFAVLGSLVIAFWSLLLIPASPAVAAADTCTWDGSSSANWSDGANWSGCDNGGVPENGDSLVFPAGAANTTNNNDLAGTLTINQMDMSGNNYVITGNPLDITGYLQFTGNNNSMNMSDFNFVSAGTGVSLVINGTGNTIVNPIDLNIAGGFDFNAYINQDFTAPIFGGVTQNFNKFGPANLTTSTSTSTFTANGAVNISEGGFICRAFDCAGNSTNSINTNSTGSLLFDNASMTVPYDIYLASSTSPQLNKMPGDVDLIGNIYVNSDSTVYAQDGTLTFSGNILLDGDDMHLLTSSVTDAHIVQANSSVISDSGTARTLNINGGHVVLEGSNTYTGVTNVNSGAVLAIRSTDGLGATSGNTVVNSGGSLVFDETTDQTIDAEPITISGNGAGGNYDGAIVNIDNNRTLTGPITLASDSTLSTRTTAALTINSAIGGTGNLYIESTDAASFVIFDGTTPNTYSGTTYVTDAHLGLVKDPNVVAVPGDLVIDGNAALSQVQANGGEQISDTGNVIMSETVAFNAQIQIGDTETVGSISGTGNIYIVGGETLHTGNNNSSTTFSGVISTAPNLSGTLNKIGTGTLTLSGSNSAGNVATYTVNGGILTVLTDYSLAPFTVNTGGTLKGTGSVGPTNVVSGGTINSGTSPGCMTVADLILNSGSNFDQEIAGSAACSGYDQTTVTGPVDLGNATLNVINTYTPTAGEVFTIITAGGGVNGTFNGLPDNTEFDTPGGIRYRINYNNPAGPNSTVTLTYISGTLAATGEPVSPIHVVAYLLLGLSAIGFGFALKNRSLLINSK